MLLCVFNTTDSFASSNEPYINLQTENTINIRNCEKETAHNAPITIELQKRGRLSLIVDVNNRREKQASKLVGVTARADNTVARSSEKRYISVVVVACMRHDVVARAFLEALFVWQAHVHLVIVCGHHAHRRR